MGRRLAGAVAAILKFPLCLAAWACWLALGHVWVDQGERQDTWLDGFGRIWRGLYEA